MRGREGCPISIILCIYAGVAVNHKAVYMNLNNLFVIPILADLVCFVFIGIFAAVAASILDKFNKLIIADFFIVPNRSRYPIVNADSKHGNYHHGNDCFYCFTQIKSPFIIYERFTR